MTLKRIVLIGAGHSNLEIIRRLGAKRDSVECLLVSPEPESIYSGLLPSCLMGNLGWPQLRIPAAQFAQARGIRLVFGQMTELDADQRFIEVEGQGCIEFDWAFLNLGGTQSPPRHAEPDGLLPLRPFHLFYERWSMLEAQGFANFRTIVIVGGGAAAVEVAVALAVRFKEQSDLSVHLFTRGQRLCTTYTPAISAAILEDLNQLNIQVHFDHPVVDVQRRELLFKDGQILAFDLCIWALPNEPQRISARGVSTDPQGFILVDQQLRASSRVFALGDCARMQSFPQLPHSGVIAVRQGQFLGRALDSILQEKEFPPFVPSVYQMNILISGERRARWVYGPWTGEGRFPFQLKRWIDLKYMNSFGS